MHDAWSRSFPSILLRKVIGISTTRIINVRESSVNFHARDFDWVEIWLLLVLDIGESLSKLERGNEAFFFWAMLIGRYRAQSSERFGNQ